MDDRGIGANRSIAPETANLLLAKRGEHLIQTVGKNWVKNYIKRYPEHTTRFSRRLDYKRAQCERPSGNSALVHRRPASC